MKKQSNVKVWIGCLVAVIALISITSIYKKFDDKKLLENKELARMSSETNIVNVSSGTNTKGDVNNKSDKELDREYIKEISPYLNEISIKWCKATTRLFTIDEECSKKTMLKAFQDIKDNWDKIFNRENRDTKNIKKLKEKLSDVCCLQKSAITDMSSAIFSEKEDGIKEGNEKLGDAIKKMKDANILIDKMK